MKTEKQTVVELRFLTTDEALKQAVLQLAKDQAGSPYYSFVYVSDKEDTKLAVKEARQYLNNLFSAANTVIVQKQTIQTESQPNKTKTISDVEVEQFAGESLV
jgi:hypothetical protein